MLAELEKHFCGVGKELLNGINACSPKSDQFLSEPVLSALAFHYHIALKSEATVAKNYMRRKTVDHNQLT